MSGWPEVRGIISDLDGVIYRGETPISDAVESVLEWGRLGIPYAFVTNNSTMSAKEFATKLCGFGVPAEEETIVTTSFVTGVVMKDRWPAGTRVYVVGAPALHYAIETAGYVVSASDPEVVVVGLDREVTYAKLKIAVRAVLSGAALIGTNPDRVIPTSDGFDPGAGSLLAAVTTAAGLARPTLLIGKPEPHMVEVALNRLGTPRRNTIMVGDQIATDIQAGKRAGLISVLVQTGVPGGRPEPFTPDFTVSSLRQIPVRSFARA